MNEQTKTCPGCNETKDASCFHKNKKQKSGLASQCKDCAKASYEKNKEQRRASCSEYYRKNKEQISERLKEYRAKAQDKIVAYRKTPTNIFSVYKSGAKKRNLSFDLTFDEFMIFWQQDCHYCKRPIPTIGIDRIDSNIGYSLENCVSCCIICNRMKLDHSLEEWQTNMLMALKGMGVI